MPLGFRIEKTGSWNAARGRLDVASKSIRGRILLAIRRAALMLEAQVKRELAAGGGGEKFFPLALSTALQRRNKSDRPLLDTGALLGSVATKVDEKRLSATVGVHRTAAGGAVNLAIIHEYGTKPYAIAVTPGIRRLFVRLSIASAGAIKPLKATTTVIHHPGVPARPFLRPALAAVLPKIESVLRVSLENG